MIAVALLISANLASNAPDRRADAHLFDIQLDNLRKGFTSRGLAIEPVRWIDPVEWTRFGAVLVNCAWDYQDRHEDFLTTLDHIAALGVPVFNSPATVRWNIRKTYLREFEAKGVPIIPALWPDRPVGEDIRDAMATFGLEDVILKRQVGGGARGQTRYTKANMPGEGSISRSAWGDPALHLVHRDRGRILLLVHRQRVQPCVDQARGAGRLSDPGSLWRKVTGDHANAARSSSGIRRAGRAR